MRSKVIAKAEYDFSLNRFFKKILFLGELFLLIMPSYFETIQVLAILIHYLKLVWILYEASYFVLHLKRREVPIPILLLVLYAVWGCGLAVLMNISRLNSTVNASVSLVLPILVLYRKSKEDFDMYSRLIAKYAAFLIILNYACYVMFPNGFYRQNLHGGGTLSGNIGYLLGIDNGFGSYLFPLMTIVLLYSFRQKGRLGVMALTTLAIMLLTYIKTHSVTGLIAALFFVVFTVLLMLEKIPKLADYRIMLILYIVFTIFMIVYGGFEHDRGPIRRLVVVELGKDLTFSGRTDIWHKALIVIGGSPIFGYGPVLNGAYIPIFGSHFGAHNFVLQTILERGWIGMILLSSCVIGFLNMIQKGYGKGKENAVICIGFFATFLYFVFESGNIMPLLIVLTLAYTDCRQNKNRRNDSFWNLMDRIHTA